MGDIEAIRDAQRSAARVRERDLLVAVRVLLDAARALVPDVDRVWLFVGPDDTGRGATLGADGAALSLPPGGATPRPYAASLSVELVVAGERAGEATFGRSRSAWSDREAALLEIAAAMTAPLLAPPLAVASGAGPERAPDGVTDELTGLYSEAFLERRLPSLVAEHAATERALCVAVLEPDGLADARGSLGPAAADAVLRAYGATLRAKLRGDDFAVRAGDQLVLVLPETDVIGAVRTIERVRSAIRKQPATALPLAFGSGIATLRPGWSAADLLAAARAELGDARFLGGGEVRSEQRA